MICSRTLLPLLALLLFCAQTITAKPSGDIVVWCNGVEGQHIGTLARRFEAEFPGTQIHTVSIPWNAARDRLVISYVGGVLPDVAQLGTTWVPEFAAIDALEPLDERMASSSIVKPESFFPSSLKTGTSKNQVVALPWYVDVRVWFYRTDLLAKAGWDHFPKTWDEMRSMTADVNKSINEDNSLRRYPLNLSTVDESTLLIHLWQAGGSILNADNSQVTIGSKASAQGLTYFKEFYTKGLTVGLEGQQIDPVRGFGNGMYAAWISGPWMVGMFRDRLAGMEDQWSVATMPRGKTGQSFIGGSNLAIMRSSENKELAWAFLEYLARPDIQAEWFKITGNLPSVSASWNTPELENDPVWQVFKEQIKESQPAPGIANWEAMSMVLKTHIEEMVYSETTPEEAVSRMESELKELHRTATKKQGNLESIAPYAVWVLGFALLAGMILLIRHSMKSQPGENRVPRTFLLVVFTPFFIFTIGPIAASLLLSFTNVDIYSLGNWRLTSFIGFENYKAILSDDLFWKSVGNTLYFVLVAAPLMIAAALAAALVLNKPNLPFRAFFRSCFFLPVVTPLVAIAIVWRWIYSPQFGLLNWLLDLVGIPIQTWLADPILAMPALIVMSIWKNFGYSMVIFLAGLQTIPKDVYEAAHIDGATKIQEFFHVTLPMLRPIFLFVVILTIIGYTQFFAEPFVMTEMGGPQNQTLSVVLYLYLEGFRFFNLGYASAVAYILCLIIAGVSIFQYLLSKQLQKGEGK